MGHLFLFTMSWISLLFVIQQIVLLELKKTNTLKADIKKHHVLSLWGIALFSLLIVIPYEAWKLTGSFHDLRGSAVKWSASIVTITFCFRYYYRQKLCFQQREVTKVLQNWL